MAFFGATVLKAVANALVFCPHAHKGLAVLCKSSLTSTLDVPA